MVRDGNIQIMGDGVNTTFEDTREGNHRRNQ